MTLKDKILLNWFQEEMELVYSHPMPYENRKKERAFFLKVIEIARTVHQIVFQKDDLFSTAVSNETIHAWLKRYDRPASNEPQSTGKSHEELYLCLAVISLMMETEDTVVASPELYDAIIEKYKSIAKRYKECCERIFIAR